MQKYFDKTVICCGKHWPINRVVKRY